LPVLEIIIYFAAFQIKKDVGWKKQEGKRRMNLNAGGAVANNHGKKGMVVVASRKRSACHLYVSANYAGVGFLEVSCNGGQ
jgi:hypothetical protein